MTDEWVLSRAAAGAPQVTTAIRWWRSLRMRTAGASAALAALLIVSVGLVLGIVTRDGAERLLEQQAAAQLRTAVATTAFGGAPAAGVTTDASAVPRALVVATRSSTEITVLHDGTSMWAARADDPSGIIATRVSDAPLRQQARVLGTTLLWTLLGGSLLAAVVSWLVAGRLTARLRATAASVNDVIGGRAPARGGARDEVVVMRDALTATAAALARRLDRERGFTADIAHDLRTPLTALVTSTQLLEPGPSADRVRRQVHRMRRLVEELLELARAELPDAAQDETADLEQCVRRAIDDLDADVPVHLLVRQPVRVHGGAGRVTTVARNLIGNALHHGAAPVQVLVEGTVLTVRDAGAGFPSALLAAGPRRFGATGEPEGGTGLGLTIVAQHCRMLGAELRLDNARGGAIATVQLRPA